MQRRHLIQAAAFAGLPTFSYAQAWPAKPLRFVVPFPPGGTTDVVTRLIAAEVAKPWGKPLLLRTSQVQAP